MARKHIGIRPIYEIVMLDFKKKIYLEEYPDGKWRLWNKRMLKSGCGYITTTLKEMRECYYCHHCDEWFSKDQWEDV